MKGPLGERELGIGFGGLQLYVVRPKEYRCEICGTRKTISTNHYVTCYEVCLQCRTQTRHECMELDLETLARRLKD